MKKTLWAIGKAAFAVIVFLYMQTAVTVPLSVFAVLSDPSASVEAVLNSVMDMVDVISVVSAALTVAALWLVWRVQGRRLTEQAHVRRIRPTQAVLSAVLGVGFCLVVLIVIGVFPWPTAWMETYAENAGEITGEWTLLGVLSTIVAAPVVEELVFRGIAYTSLKSVMPRGLAAVLVSAVFGLLHGTVIWFFYTFALSLVMIWVFEQTESLWGCILVHMAFNTVGQLPLMGENPSFVQIVLVAGIGAALIGVTAVLLYATRPQEETPPTLSQNME